MGTGECGTPPKTTKTPTIQELPGAPSYAEWAAAFQAYYGSAATPPPPGYYPSTVISGPQPHPYMWGGQPLIPSPHTALYSYGGIYAHPSMQPEAIPISTDPESKVLEGKDHNAIRESKRSIGKGNEAAKGTSDSANGHTQSGESGSVGSSEGSEQEDTTENLNADGVGGSNNPPYIGADPYMTQGGHAIGNPVNQAAAASQTTVTGKPALVVGPTTNLNIGMDYWSGPAPVPFNAAKGKRNIPVLTNALVPSSNSQLVSGRDGVPTELWLQDERELKRQKRKQSNRESARRSRLRKQAECEELSKRVDAITVENMALRTELNRLAEECKKLSSQNAILSEKLWKIRGVGTAGAQQEANIVNGHSIPPENELQKQDGLVKDERGDAVGKITISMSPGSHPEAVGATG
eukprot:c28196_g2_i2 orf=451-1671(+)